MSPYHWCAVYKCRNTSVKTPDKLWIKVPNKINKRKTWLELARRDSEKLSTTSILHFCEDHFDLENDMENYMEYKIMGSIKRIRLRPDCEPSRFDWNGEHELSSDESHDPSAKRLKISEEIVEDHIIESDTESSDSVPFIENICDEAVQIIQEYEHTYSPSETSLSITNSDTISTSSLQTECNKIDKINLLSTLFKINNNPKSYIGLPKNLYFLIGLIKKHTNYSEPHILLCLMKIKLNKPFSELGDDFDVSVNEARGIFFNTMPWIVSVLSPFIRQFSKKSINKNLPIPLRHKLFHQVTCIIDCLEIEIQRSSKAIQRALTWSESKKTNTVKYLISCTPDGLVNFVSEGYGGRISDKSLLEQSGFLECLLPGSLILTDRGFCMCEQVESYILEKGFVLLRLPSDSAGMKLTKVEVIKVKQIASLRIHVKRVIRQLREFNMFKMHSVINSNLISVLDLCVFIACALINLQNGL